MCLEYINHHNLNEFLEFIINEFCIYLHFFIINEYLNFIEP